MRRMGILGCVSLAVCGLVGVGVSASASTKAPRTAASGATSRHQARNAGGRVLRVGTYHGVKGQFTTIQSAVNHAKPGDTILVAPGDYKTTSSTSPKGVNIASAVLVTTPGITIRGMNRKTVVVDGTKPGFGKCSSKPAAQNLGPMVNGQNEGLNGIVAYHADNVNVENLTACNFLSGPGGDTGNEIWWDGLNPKNQIDGWGFLATYLTTTSTYYDTVSDAAAYGLFSSAWQGGIFANDYASNFDDAGFYIGACHQLCTQIIKNSRSEFNALGYSGSNSGGTMLVEHNRFDHNKDGFDTNSQNGDNPPPQNGACPKGIKPPVKGAKTCWVLYKNLFDHNNDPNVPQAGSASQGPVGTGVSLSGARNDTVLDNKFVANGAWGTIIVPYPDSGPPCTGGIKNDPLLGSGSCLYDEYGDQLLNNTYKGNGFFGNPTNGDFDQLNLQDNEKTDCYSGNTDASGKLNAEALKLQKKYHCNGSKVAANVNFAFLNEVQCDTGVSLTGGNPCASTDHYPRQKQVVMQPVPKTLKTMANPCAGIPNNPWCPKKK